MHPPEVSIIVPCYNEARTIRLMLDGIIAQTFPIENMEVVIADGMSTDLTRKVITEFQEQHPELRIRIVDNPARNIPAALNHALRAAEGSYIIRLDAHSRPKTTYVERCIKALQEGRGDNVGGVWNIAPGAQTWIAESIAAAAAHPLGVGDAKYRHTSQAQYVETVPFGAFKRDLIEQIGVFDETLLSNEDYEFNTRILKNGGKIWLDPEIQTTYYARATLADLARQYLRYGYWKGRMLKRYPETIRLRQMAPPLFVIGVIAGGIAALVLPWLREIYLLALAIYFILITAAALKTSLKLKNPGLLIGMPAAISTMHFCWGSALLWSLAKK